MSLEAQSDISPRLRAFVEAVPHSTMVKPRELGNRLKYHFWRMYTPYHPGVRDALQRLGITRHCGRQHFLLGRVRPGESIEEFISFLIAQGFKNHFVAWKDDGELVSLRYVENFTYQYHLRVFQDGEVRGHYEYTPECYPLAHLLEMDMEERRPDFMRFLGDRVLAAEA